MSVHGQLGLERGRLVTAEQERTEHTLKTKRILLSSEFQATMVSLSFLAWKSREAALRPLCLMTLFCISATVLGMISRRTRDCNIAGPTHVLN